MQYLSLLVSAFGLAQALKVDLNQPSSQIWPSAFQQAEFSEQNQICATAKYFQEKYLTASHEALADLIMPFLENSVYTDNFLKELAGLHQVLTQNCHLEISQNLLNLVNLSAEISAILPQNIYANSQYDAKFYELVNILKARNLEGQFSDQDLSELYFATALAENELEQLAEQIEAVIYAKIFDFSSFGKEFTDVELLDNADYSTIISKLAENVKNFSSTQEIEPEIISDLKKHWINADFYNGEIKMFTGKMIFGYMNLLGASFATGDEIVTEAQPVRKVSSVLHEILTGKSELRSFTLRKKLSQAIRP